MKTRLSNAQFIALLWAAKHGDGVLVRRPGGFWTIRDLHFKHPWKRSGGYRVPFWYTASNTVMAMERWGLVKIDSGYDEPNLQYWQAPRIVTDVGRQALEAAEAAGQRNLVKVGKLADDLKLYDEFALVMDGVKKGLGI